mgnify:CR=1 FL=1
MVITPIDSLPEVALAPDQLPEAVQEVALVEDQVRVREDAPFAAGVRFDESDTVGTPGGEELAGAELSEPPPPQAERPRPANRAAKTNLQRNSNLINMMPDI